MPESTPSAAVATAPPGTPQVNRSVVISVMIMGAFVSILNQTLLNVAIPHLMNAFGVDADTVQWLSTGYQLTNGIVIPVSAFLIAVLTTRQLFIACMSVFTAGTLICALAPNFTVMLVGRIVQAAGAGVLMPLMMTVIMRLFPPETRGRAMGVIGVAMFFAPAVGPTLSGWMIEHWSWRLLFYVVIPIALADILAAYFALQNVTERTPRKFDVWGFLTSTLGFGTLLYGFSEAGSKNWNDFQYVTLPICIGLVSLAVFVAIELTTETPMLNLRVFRYKMFSLACLVSSVVNMAIFGGALLVPIYIQNIRGYSALDSGLLLLPGAILMGAMSPVSGALLDRYGIRPLALIGLTITAITTYDYTKLDLNTTYGHVMMLYTLRMFGMSFIAMTIMTSGLNELPLQLASHGSASANTVRMAAASLGTALLVTQMSTQSKVVLNDYANHFTALNPYLYNTVHGVGSLLAIETGQPQDNAMTLAQQIFYGYLAKLAEVGGINDAFMLATLLSVVALVLSAFLKMKPKGKRA
ncbi:MAG: DHA2 family efflux MFS transporter permease subunit [Alicyclobacillus sp.]|nr:DHA2 family efflux MFS transporter permease subunit [Alicyclobacillus sp.]